VSAGSQSGRIRVGLIGHGAIGRVVAHFLMENRIPGCELAGVLTQSQSCLGRVGDIYELMDSADLIVEAAGQEAMATYGLTVIEGGIDLLVLSVGALVDDTLREALRHAAGGRVMISTGAIGGLDLLRAAAYLGPLDSVSLQTIKPASAVIQKWMDNDLVARLTNPTAPVEAFNGSARSAATKFPSSANVAATLGLATIGLDKTQVTIVGGPEALQMQHTIKASGAAGTYEFSIRNRASDNPRTSAVTPYAVVRALTDTTSRILIGV
jgi:aspartate dehydrogenase